MRDNRPFKRNGIWYVWNDRGNRVSLRTRERRVALERAAAMAGGRGRSPRLSAAIARFRRESKRRSPAHRRAIERLSTALLAWSTSATAASTRSARARCATGS